MMLLKKKTLIYQNKAGYKLFEDSDQKLILQNKMGQMIKPTAIKPFIRSPGVKQAITKFYNKEIRFATPVKFKIKPIKKGERRYIL